MIKVSQFRQHAEECRALARRTIDVEHREMLIRMAASWDDLADRRERELQKQGLPTD